ncbi:MAG: FtsQ-type POTRA domain-containing protein [Eggerthellaceae bacterium]|nr:FtsQ-type POTRA domain-containing protein [Eggerthellaceae bacterium]
MSAGAGGRTTSRHDANGGSRAASRNAKSARSEERVRTTDKLPDGDVHAYAGGRYEEASDRKGRSRTRSSRSRKADVQVVADPIYSSTRVGDLRNQSRQERMARSARRYFVRIALVLGIVAALIIGGAVVYNSNLFTVEHVEVNGVEHLTSDEMAQMANVPAGVTLLRVDTDAIANRIRKNAWVQDVSVVPKFPDTLQINVIERKITAIVEVPLGKAAKATTTATSKQWAIAEDHVWLRPSPEQDSEAAKTTSSKVYEDAEAALHITDVPYGTKTEIGAVCVDNNVNNALDIVSGLTTELADMVVTVSAAGPVETTLLLDNGVEIAFGKAENVRDKERVILKIMEENENGVAYINVRNVSNPTWRAI